MLSFLYPSVLWGLWGVLAPLALHLFRKRYQRTVPFAFVGMLQQIQQRHRVRLMFQDQLLLILRMAFIALVVLGLAGPRWGVSTAHRETEVKLGILVVDDSFSMTAGLPGQPTPWEQVPEIAQTIFASRSSSWQWAAIRTSAPRLPDQFSPIPELVLEQIQQWHPVRAPSGIERALRLAIQTPTTPASKIWVITDGQQHGWHSVLAAPEKINGWYQQAGITPTEGVVQVVSLADTPRANVWVDPSRVPALPLAPYEPGEVYPVVRASEAADELGLPLHIQVTGDAMVEPTNPEPIMSLHREHPVTLAFQVQGQPTDASLALVIEPEIAATDTLPEDNQATIMLPALPHGNVWLMTNTTASVEARALAQALDLSQLGTLAVAAPLEEPAFLVRVRQFHELSALPLQTNDVVVAMVDDNCLEIGESALSLTRAFVSNGGRMIVVAQWEPDQQTAVLEVLRQLLEPMTGQPIQGVECSEGCAPRWVNATHPLVRDLGLWGLSALRDTTVWNGWTTPNAVGMVLASLQGSEPQSNMPMLQVFEHGQGKFITLSAGLAPHQSDLLFQPMFVPLVHVCLKYLFAHEILNGGDLHTIDYDESDLTPLTFENWAVLARHGLRQVDRTHLATTQQHAPSEHKPFIPLADWILLCALLVGMTEIWWSNRSARPL